MANKQQYIIEFDAKTGKVTSAIDGLKGELKGVSDQAKDTGKAVGDSTGKIADTIGGLLDKFTGGLVTAFKSASNGVRSMFPALTGLKGAIISTGVGALIVLLGVLIANFDKIKGFITGDLARAEGLKKSNAELDVMISKEQGITQILEAQGATRYEINKSKERSIALQLKQIENQIELARLEDEEEELQKVLLEYEKLKNAERLLAVENESDLNDVLEKAKGILDKKYKNQAEVDKSNLEFVEQREIVERELNTLLANTEHTKKQIAKYDDGSAKNAGWIRLQKAIQAEDEARILILTGQKKLLDDAIAKNTENILDKQKVKVKEVKKEVDELKSAYNDSMPDPDDGDDFEEPELDFPEFTEKLKASKTYYQRRKEQEQEFDRIMAKAAEDRTDKEIKELERREQKEKYLAKGKRDLAQAAVDVALELGAFLSEKQDKEAKRGFDISKKISIATATISGIEGVINAMTAKSIIPEPFATATKIANATAIGLSTLTNIAKIESMTFGGGGGGGGSAPSSSTPSAPEQSAPQIDFGFLQQGNNQNTIQAYVIAQNVTNSTQANQLVKDQAAL